VITTFVGSWNVASRRAGDVTPGQRPDVVTGNEAEAFVVRRCVELLHALLGMWTGLVTLTVQRPPPMTMSATEPELLTAVASTDVALVAVKVHVPVVVTVVEPIPRLLEQVVKFTGLVVPAAVARSPEAVRLVSPTLQVTVAPAVSVLVPTCVPVTATPCGSQLAADADETPTSDAASTRPSGTHLNIFMVFLLTDHIGLSIVVCHTEGMS
jgi:hypothetical protein